MIPVDAQSAVTAIDSGGNQNLALKDGRIIAWGESDGGLTPIPFDAQSGITAIAAGGTFNLALHG